MNIRWTANDPDADDLQYTLYFRGEGESEWKLLAEELQQPFFQLTPDVLPDGKYRVRVVASDAGANPAAAAKSAEKISAPFVLDSTPPQVEMLEATRKGASAIARFRAKDNADVLTRAEYVVDAGSPVALLSDDGLLDSPEETFVISLDSLDGREHLLTLRVYDSAGNVGMGKAVWPPSGAKSSQ
ncbi:MAG: fibronectin type III domain-containing protein [Acidobacteria bacterium]|nr:fibronectin type III domain-containing protein [Acidobacteriota bacterium]